MPFPRAPLSGQSADRPPDDSYTVRALDPFIITEENTEMFARNDRFEPPPRNLGEPQSVRDACDRQQRQAEADRKAAAEARQEAEAEL